MYKGSKQGGGGSQFVGLLGMYPPKRDGSPAKGVGFIRQQDQAKILTALVNVFKQANAAGVDTMVMLSESRFEDGPPLRLVAAPSSRQPQQSEGQQRREEARQSTVRAPRERKNPEPDELDKLLEKFE
jgi:hypothetical protein